MEVFLNIMISHAIKFFQNIHKFKDINVYRKIYLKYYTFSHIFYTSCHNLYQRFPNKKIQDILDVLEVVLDNTNSSYLLRDYFRTNIFSIISS